MRKKSKEDKQALAELKSAHHQSDIEFMETSEKIRVPDGIWTHNPPWSSRML